MHQSVFIEQNRNLLKSIVVTLTTPQVDFQQKEEKKPEAIAKVVPEQPEDVEMVNEPSDDHD
jgi:hypothetical protein